jgi:hypothetical protein
METRAELEKVRSESRPMSEGEVAVHISRMDSEAFRWSVAAALAGASVVATLGALFWECRSTKS